MLRPRARADKRGSLTLFRSRRASCEIHVYTYRLVRSSVCVYIYICIRVYTHTPEAKEKMQRRLLHGNIKGDGAGAKKGTHIDTKSREKKDLRLFVCVHVRVCWG